MVVIETFPVVPLWTTWKYSGTDALKFAGTFGAKPGMSLLTGLFRSTGSRTGPRAVPVVPSDARLSNAESSQKADAADDDPIPAPAGAVVAATTARIAVMSMKSRFTFLSPIDGAISRTRRGRRPLFNAWRPGEPGLHERTVV
jgi:hypothetical protein